MGGDTPAVLAVNNGIVVRIGGAGVQALKNRTVDNDIDTIRAAITDIGKGTAGAIKVDHQIVQPLIIGLG